MSIGVVNGGFGNNSKFPISNFNDEPLKVDLSSTSHLSYFEKIDSNLGTATTTQIIALPRPSNATLLHKMVIVVAGFGSDTTISSVSITNGVYKLDFPTIYHNNDVAVYIQSTNPTYAPPLTTNFYLVFDTSVVPTANSLQMTTTYLYE